VAGDKTSIGDGGKSDCYGDKVGGQETASRAMVRAMVRNGEAHPDDNIQHPGPRRQPSTSGAAGDNDRHRCGRRE